jgi:hypothetical protein
MILQLEDGAVALLTKAIEEEGLDICTEGIQKHRTIDEYVQAWRIQIWDYGYMGWFKGKEAYTKTKAFEDHRSTDLAVKRVIFRYVCNGLTCYSLHPINMNDIKCNLCIPLRYFMRELVPLGAVVKPELPMFLTSWVDKTSAQCMYTMTQTRAWSVPHLQAGCWYIECGKTICPVEEEEVKAACDKADSRDAALGPDHVDVPKELTDADLVLLPEKERNKILNQRTRDAKKADREATRDTAKAVKESITAKGKEGKKVEKPGKSKAITPALLLTETSYASPSPNPRKRAASVAQLSVSRLQQLASPSLIDSAGGALCIQEFFFSGSLLSTDAYFMDQKAFPKEWMDMKAFLEMVCIFSCLLSAL